MTVCEVPLAVIYFLQTAPFEFTESALVILALCIHILVMAVINNVHIIVFDHVKRLVTFLLPTVYYYLSILIGRIVILLLHYHILNIT